MTVDGLDAYAAAPEAVETPGWLLEQEPVWARTGDRCVPAEVDEPDPGLFQTTACGAGDERGSRCSWVSAVPSPRRTFLHSTCMAGAESFRVVEFPRGRPPLLVPDHVTFDSARGRVDCRDRCPVFPPEWEAALYSVVGRRFVRSDEPALLLHRTERACLDAPPSDVCPAWRAPH